MGAVHCLIQQRLCILKKHPKLLSEWMNFTLVLGEIMTKLNMSGLQSKKKKKSLSFTPSPSKCSSALPANWIKTCLSESLFSSVTVWFPSKHMRGVTASPRTPSVMCTSTVGLICCHRRLHFYWIWWTTSNSEACHSAAMLLFIWTVILKSQCELKRKTLSAKSDWKLKIAFPPCRLYYSCTWAKLHGV